MDDGETPVLQLSEEALTAWGAALGAAAAPPLVLTLSGELGAGKTTLARAIARGAGVRGAIPSPTYNLLFRYDAVGGRSIAHLDLYRLEEADEVWALGWSELPGEREVVLIEWPERAQSLLPADRWEIELREGSEHAVRAIRVRRVGDPHPIVLPEVPA